MHGRREVGAIKHRAPNGALRLATKAPIFVCYVDGHKAPSAKRCIKTDDREGVESGELAVES